MTSSCVRLLHRGKLKTVVCLLALSLLTLLLQMHNVFTVRIDPNSARRPRSNEYLARLTENSPNVDNVQNTTSRTFQGRDILNGAFQADAAPEVVADNPDPIGIPCPIKYNFTACAFEINSQPSEKINREANGRVIRYIYKFRQGIIFLNGAKVHSWKTTGNLVVLQVAEECRVSDSRIYPNPEDPVKKDDEEFAAFVDKLPDGAILLGVLYGDTTTYSKVLSDLGLIRKVVSQMVFRRGILAFQLRKSYPGHSTFLVNPKGGGNNTILRRDFFIGYPFRYNSNSIPYGSVLQMHPEIQTGGHWHPKDCDARWRIAIIIPFRQRELHLWTFLENIFRFLQLQNIDFTVIVVEQAGDVLFNRAALMNIGYIEAKKLGHFDCFAFHDVDQIPEDLSNLYACPEMPRHLVVTRSVTEYRLRVEYYFGGAIMMKPEHIDQINGFPNRIFGWGGEDDEIWARVVHVGMSVLRYPMEIGRYRSLSHGQDKSNPHVDSRKSLDILQSIARYIDRDGLNTMQYDIISIDKRPLYTHIIAYIPGPSKLADIKPIVNMTTKAPTLPPGILVEEVQIGDVEIDTYYNSNDKSNNNNNINNPLQPPRSRKLPKDAQPQGLNRSPSGRSSALAYRPQSHRVVDDRPGIPVPDVRDEGPPPPNQDLHANGGKLPQGMAALKQLIRDNPNLVAELLKHRHDTRQSQAVGGLHPEAMRSETRQTLLNQLLQQNLLAEQQLLNQAPGQSYEGDQQPQQRRQIHENDMDMKVQHGQYVDNEIKGPPR